MLVVWMELVINDSGHADGSDMEYKEKGKSDWRTLRRRKEEKGR